MKDTPPVEVHIVERDEVPGGVGELGYPSIPTAVANAILAATGKRLRKMPFRSSDLRRA